MFIGTRTVCTAHLHPGFQAGIQPRLLVLSQPLGTAVLAVRGPGHLPRAGDMNASRAVSGLGRASDEPVVILAVVLAVLRVRSAGGAAKKSQHMGCLCWRWRLAGSAGCTKPAG
jgi:hypothetical protein